jgi:hypothetical protein
MLSRLVDLPREAESVGVESIVEILSGGRPDPLPPY